MKTLVIYTGQSKAYVLACFLLENIWSYLPGFKEPDLQIWSKTMDDMIEEDKRDQVEITDVIVFALNDGFWQKVILSPYDLRKHFDRMKAIMYCEQDRRDQMIDAEMASSILAEDADRDSYPDGSKGYHSIRSIDREDWEDEDGEYAGFFR